MGMYTKYLCSFIFALY